MHEKPDDRPDLREMAETLARHIEHDTRHATVTRGARPEHRQALSLAGTSC